MWEHKCQAERKRGGQCTRTSTTAVWCHNFQGEHFGSATWVEVCGHHVIGAREIISMLDI